VSWALVQPGVPEDFVCAEREEDEVWQAQLDIGGQIDACLQHVLQLHWQEEHNVTTVGALPSFCSFLIMSARRPLMSYCSQQLMALSRDKSVKMANLYSRVDWLEKYGASLGVRMDEAYAQVSTLEA